MGGCQSFIFTLCYSLGDVVYDIQYVENFFSSGRNNLVVEVLGGGGGVMVVCPIMSRVALEGAECKVF